MASSTRTEETVGKGPGSVLVAVDDSEAAVRLVGFVAKHFSGYKLVLAHVHCKEVYPGPTSAGAAFFSADAEADNNARAERELRFLNETLTPNLEAQGIHPETELLRINASGSKAVSDALCKRAAKLNSTFLALRKHNKSFAAEFFVGSVTKECIGRAPCAVLALLFLFSTT